MKIKVFNKKTIKKLVLDRVNAKTISKFKPNSSTIPLTLYNANSTVNASMMDVVNSLPKELKMILEGGNNPISVKKNSSTIEIKTDTKLTILVRTDTLCDRIPQCKITDKSSSGNVVLLNTFKVTH